MLSEKTIPPPLQVKWSFPNDSERNYPQVEKEVLALIFGVKKFHKNLYGRRFLLVIDHKPLTTIIGPKKGVPTLAAAKLQRWALLLSGYQYDIQYRCSEDSCKL